MEQFAIPAWVLVVAVPLGVLGLLNLKTIFLWAYHQADLDTLRTKLWAEGLPRPIFTIALLFWSAVFLSLFVGLLHLIWTVLLVGFEEDAREFRFLLAKITALTAVLGAVVALPFTVIRLRITSEQNRHAEDSLFNEKMNAAIADLHAQRQVTIEEKGNRFNAWEDDVVRRNGAVDRLEALARERPRMVQRISDMLSVHLKELTRKHPAAPLPTEVTTNALQDWKAKVQLNRGDIEFAARALGRLEERGRGSTRLINRDLSGVNLQGCDLSGLNFRNADFTFTNLQGSNCAGSDFSKATFTSAKLEHSKFNFANLVDADLSFSEACYSDFSCSRMQGTLLEITNLQHSNLSFCELDSAQFTETDMTGANFDDAELTNVNISQPVLDENASFIGTNFFGAGFHFCDLSRCSLGISQLCNALGDKTVHLPPNTPPPPHWVAEELEWSEFDYEWDLYKSDPDAYIPPQDRDDTPSED